MSARAEIGVGLLGLGVVGQGVFAALRSRSDAYERRCGARLAVRAAAVRDAGRERGLDLSGVQLGTDPLSVCTDDSVDVVVELMGGEEPAAECIAAALRAGKPVVTANKEVMAKRGAELLALAAERETELRYEASAGGGIPIIGVLQRDLPANEISSVRAIINGTTNYMLTRMSQSGASYADALAEAQELGYAEADPASDVDGIDAAYKLAILASLAFHARVAPETVHREGIRGLSGRDFAHAADLGYTIKMLATGRRTGEGLDLRVHPTLVPLSDPMARVDGVLNAVAVTGEPLGTVVLEGPGAGAGATSSAVMGDLLDVASALANGGAGAPRTMAEIGEAELAPLSEVRLASYIRLAVPDRAGVLADLGRTFASEGVSIASVLQAPSEGGDADGAAELIITTHPCADGAVDRVLALLERSESVLEACVRVRIEGGAE